VTEEERREMMRSNWAAQMASMGYGPDGMALPPSGTKTKDTKPELLSLEDVKAHAGNGLKDGCFWIETRYGSLAPAFLDICVQGELRVYSPFMHPGSNPDSNMTWWGVEYYGAYWRVWDKRPTADQTEREAWPKI